MFVLEVVDECNDTACTELSENTRVNKLPANIHSRLCALLDADNLFGDNWERC